MEQNITFRQQKTEQSFLGRHKNKFKEFSVLLIKISVNQLTAVIW